MPAFRDRSCWRRRRREAALVLATGLALGLPARGASGQPAPAPATHAPLPARAAGPRLPWPEAGEPVSCGAAVRDGAVSGAILGALFGLLVSAVDLGGGGLHSPSGRAALQAGGIGLLGGGTLGALSGACRPRRAARRPAPRPDSLTRPGRDSTRLRGEPAPDRRARDTTTAPSPPNEALQLSSTPGRPGAPAASAVHDP